jgi:Spy/CpxP family protein refolding chaperone
MVRPSVRTLCFFLALCRSGSLLWAQVEVPPGKWWKNNPGLTRELNLGPQQVDRIDRIFEDYRERLLDLQHDLRKKALELERMLDAETIDEARVEAQVTAVESARAELATQRMMMSVKIRGQLRPDQWRLLRERYATRQLQPPRLPPRQRRF